LFRRGVLQPYGGPYLKVAIRIPLTPHEWMTSDHADEKSDRSDDFVLRVERALTS
jgi:hypothetical protein